MHNKINQIFNQLTIIEYLDNKKVLCKCDCGNIKELYYSNVIKGNNKSCGCRQGRRSEYKWFLNDKEEKGNNPFRKVVTVSRSAAAKRSISFNIDHTFIQSLYELQKGKCYYTNIEMTLNRDQYSISIDRLDSSKSYEKSNVVLCCRNINLFKNTLSDIEFKEFLRKVKDS